MKISICCFNLLLSSLLVNWTPCHLNFFHLYSSLCEMSDPIFCSYLLSFIQSSTLSTIELFIVSLLIWNVTFFLNNCMYIGKFLDFLLRSIHFFHLCLIIYSIISLYVFISISCLFFKKFLFFLAHFLLWNFNQLIKLIQKSYLDFDWDCNGLLINFGEIWHFPNLGISDLVSLTFSLPIRNQSCLKLFNTVFFGKL